MEYITFVLMNKDAQYLLIPDTDHPENYMWVDSFDIDCALSKDKMLEVAPYFCGVKVHEATIKITINPQPSFMVPHEA